MGIINRRIERGQGPDHVITETDAENPSSWRRILKSPVANKYMNYNRNL